MGRKEEAENKTKERSVEVKIEGLMQGPQASESSAVAMRRFVGFFRTGCTPVQCTVLTRQRQKGSDRARIARGSSEFIHHAQRSTDHERKMHLSLSCH